jgi:acyl carrier protein
MENLQQKVVDAVARAVPLDPRSVKHDSTFEELGVDSLDAVNIVFELETVLKIKLPEEFAVSEPSDVMQLTAAMKTLLDEREGCPA